MAPTSSRVSLMALGATVTTGGVTFTALRSVAAPGVSARNAAAQSVTNAAAPTASLATLAGTGSGVAVATIVAMAVTRRGHAGKAGRARSSQSLRAFENELGVQPPVGFWDPAGYTSGGDVDDFRRRRETEIKHGRVSMIAAIGYIVPEYFRWPGSLSPSKGIQFADVPNGLKALQTIPAFGWLQIVLFAGFVEVGYFTADPARAPGDFANAGVFGVPNAGGSLEDAETQKRKLSAELANGRLAMMAIIGMFFQDGLTGSAWGDWALYTDSPLRAEPVSAAVAAAAAAKAAAVVGGGKAMVGASAAGAGVAGTGAAATLLKKGDERPEYEPFGPGSFDPTKQIGALPPLGYWDPAGLTRDEATFRQFRTAEIKHARVAMMASVGILAQHAYRFPGFETSIPPGVQALTNPQAQQGFALMFLLAGFYELNFWTESESKFPGDFGDPAGWASTFPGLVDERGLPTEDIRNKELNNGRVAMLFIMGIFAAEYQTGLDGVEQLQYAVNRWKQMGGFENFAG